VARELRHQIWIEVSNQLIWKCKTVEHKNKYKTWTNKTYLYITVLLVLQQSAYTG